MIFAAFFIMNNFRDNLVFFYTPTDLATKEIKQGKIIRVGGLVVEGSIVKKDNLIEFILTDINSETRVKFNGILPSLFREGQGIVAQGTLSTDNTFIATNMLAKHDEKYMPAEIADALKESGNWHPEKFK